MQDNVRHAPRATPKFDSESAAMILIDQQVGTGSLVRTIDVNVAIRNAALLAKTAIILGMPIVVTSSEETNFQGPIADEIQKAAPDAFARRVRRQGIVDAWEDPNFKKAVEATNRRQLIMSAFTTDICLVFPTISAVNDGYAVKAVMDASGSPFELSEDMARRQMQDQGVVLTATITIVAELVRNWAGPHGPELQKLMMATLPTSEAARA